MKREEQGYPILKISEDNTGKIIFGYCIDSVPKIPSIEYEIFIQAMQEEKK